MPHATMERTRRAPAELRPPVQYAISRWLPLCGRLLIAVLFLTSGIGKLVNWEGAVGYATAERMVYPALLTGVAAAVELLFGLAIALGYYTRVAALALAVFLVPTTFIFHDFWGYEGMDRGMQMIHFFKNLAIIGGLLVLGSYGPGRVGVDHKVHY